MNGTELIAAAILIEATVRALREAYTNRTINFEIVAGIALGVALAWMAKLDLLDDMGLDVPVPINYVLSGIILGRGSQFLRDLFGRLNGDQGKGGPRVQLRSLRSGR